MPRGLNCAAPALRVAAMCLLLPSPACTGPLVLNDKTKARAAIDEAHACEAQSRPGRAAEIYLSCLASCPMPMALVGEHLHRLSAIQPGLEAEVWKQVEQIEDGLAGFSKEERHVRLSALSTVYSAWHATERVSLLRRKLRSALPTTVFHRELVLVAVIAPDTIVDLTDDEAAAIDRYLSSAKQMDAEVQADRRVSREMAVRLDDARLRRTVTLAAALVNGGRRDLAVAALDRELSGGDPAACHAMLEETSSPEVSNVAELLCARCAEAPECKKDPSPPQPQHSR